MYLHMCMKTTGIEEGLIISLSEETCTNSKVGLMGFLFFDVFHLTELAREREKERRNALKMKARALMADSCTDAPLYIYIYI